MSDDDPEVPIVCQECRTRSRIPLARVAESIDRHNDRLHDGESVAEVDPAIKDQLADMVAADLGLLEES